MYLNNNFIVFFFFPVDAMLAVIFWEMDIVCVNANLASTRFVYSFLIKILHNVHIN